jgi:L-alanine-DL-glutamate epimerase-like enolase superfamily enzyme
MKIERIEVIVTDLPGRLQRHTSSGAYDTGASGSLLGKPVLVKLYAGGVVGLGQIRPITPQHFLADTVHSMVAAIAEVYGPRLIGTPIADLENAWSMFDRVLHGNPTARAALDHALHDAIGKALGVPVHQLLGGLCQPRIPLEWSVSLHDDTAAIVDEATRAVEAFGIKVLCIKAGDRRGWRRDLENFAAVRRAVGNDVAIGVDPNTAWSLPDAKRAILALAEHGLAYVEQPIERHNLAGLKALRAMANGIPLMADESLMSLHDAHALAAAQAVDVFCIKLYKHGGLRAARKIAAVAEAAGLQLNVGGLAAFCQLEAAAGAHFYASIPTRLMMPAAEFAFGVGAIGADPLVPETDFVLADGHVAPPTRPGLGIALDDTAVERLTLRKEVVR